ncbi:nuclear transport factor 2 family protein [Stutzerimonas nosocomialis]|nr:nuclear transport factor 2 family protein [Stutzerimonas nosocomialis]
MFATSRLYLSMTGLLLALAGFAEAREHDEASHNTTLVQKAFDDWKAGRGSVFDLLADDAQWTVAGSSPDSGTYRSREELMTRAVVPINARLSTPITPEVKHLVAQGDEVVVLWDGRAMAKDGSPYENSYAWHLVFEDGRITRVTAFLDTWQLDRLMR